MVEISSIEELARREALAASIQRALAALRRHGYTAGDLDFLLYEGQAGTPGDQDPDLDDAIGLLGYLREAGIVVR